MNTSSFGHIVKLSHAASASGSAYIGPSVGSGFATEDPAAAHRFTDVHEAERIANHFRGWWRGFAGFDPAQISVEIAADPGPAT